MWRCVLLACLAVPASFASQQVHVVGPGQEYTSLQAAIDAAGDGDVILVKEGHHPTAAIDGKGLAIVADDPADLGFHRIGTLVISNLPVGRTVHVRGFQFSEAASVLQRLRVSDCAGAVLVEDCQLDKATVSVVAIENGSAVVLTRCILEGAKGHSMIGRPGAPALTTTNSSVAIYDCVLAGGDGGNDSSPDQLYSGPPTDGGDGAVVHGGSLFASGSTLSGGDGGDMLTGLSLATICGDGGNGAALDGGAIFRRLNSPLLPGAAGTANYPRFGLPGNPGEPLVVIDGVAASIAEFARRLEIASPIREGQSTQLTMTGQPNEPCWILFSLAAQPIYASGLRGTLVPALPVTVVGLGNLPSGGVAAIPIQLPAGALPPGIEAVPIHLQGMFAGASGPILLSSPSTLVVIDDAL